MQNQNKSFDESANYVVLISIFFLLPLQTWYLPTSQALLTYTLLFFLINVTNLYLNSLQAEGQSVSVQWVQRVLVTMAKC